MQSHKEQWTFKLNKTCTIESPVFQTDNHKLKLTKKVNHKVLQPGQWTVASSMLSNNK